MSDNTEIKSATLKLAFIGGGNMAEALIKGVINSPLAVEPYAIRVSDPLAARRDFLAETYNISVFKQNADALDAADLVILSVKPQLIEAVLKDLQDQIKPEQVVVSIAAGVTIDTLKKHLYADSKVVRTMPNTPALVGEGATAITPGPGVTPQELDKVRRVFEAVGQVVMVAENQMDAVTAVSGSGPAYIFTIIEALADGGVKMGLPRATAITLAAQTVLGAARMVKETGTHPAGLKDMVTSPGGTTAAGLHVLEAAAVRGAIIGAVEAAALKGKSLS